MPRRTLAEDCTTTWRCSAPKCLFTNEDFEVVAQHEYDGHGPRWMAADRIPQQTSTSSRGEGASDVRYLVDADNVEHVIECGATRSLCGVPLAGLYPQSPQLGVPAPCIPCPIELALLHEGMSAE